MPSYFPEGNEVLAGDNELRTLQKWCQKLYDSVGQRSVPFPEGTKPLAGDDEERLLKKINAMRNG